MNDDKTRNEFVPPDRTNTKPVRLVDEPDREPEEADPPTPEQTKRGIRLTG